MPRARPRKPPPWGRRSSTFITAGAPNPHINYPFLALDQLSARVKDAHAHNLKLKIYYTLRELSSYVTEFWAVRSLGNEIFYPGLGFQTVVAPPDAKTGGARPGQQRFQQARR